MEDIVTKKSGLPTLLNLPLLYVYTLNDLDVETHSQYIAVFREVCVAAEVLSQSFEDNACTCLRVTIREMLRYARSETALTNISSYILI